MPARSNLNQQARRFLVAWGTCLVAVLVAGALALAYWMQWGAVAKD